MATATKEAPATQKGPEPVTLRSLHDYALTTNALEHRAEELKKLSKKNSEEGYFREARSVDADIASIEHQILPCFRNQRELPLVTDEQLRTEVEGALRRVVTKAFAGLGDPKVLSTPEMIAHRRDECLRILADRIALYSREVADTSFSQGLAAREQTPEALALRAVQTLRAID